MLLFYYNKIHIFYKIKYLLVCLCLNNFFHNKSILCLYALSNYSIIF